MVLYTTSLYLSYAVAIAATLPEGGKVPAIAPPIVAIPFGVIHGLVVLIRSSSFSLPRRMLSSLLAGTAGGLLIFGIGEIGLALPEFPAKLFAWTVYIPTVLLQAFGGTILADRLLDPVGRS